MRIRVISRPAVFHLPQLCSNFHCCGAFLHLLHKAWRLHRAQGLHQHQPHPLRHHFHRLHSAQDPGTVWTSLRPYWYRCTWKHIKCTFVLFVTGSSATLRFAPGFTHLPLHHVCHLVRNDQQSKWVSSCLVPQLQLFSLGYGCSIVIILTVFCQYIYLLIIYCSILIMLVSFYMASYRNKELLFANSWHTFPTLVVAVGLVVSTVRPLKNIYTKHLKCIETIHI